MTSLKHLVRIVAGGVEGAWAHQQTTYWSRFIALILMARPAWALIMCVGGVLLLSLGTPQGREAVKFALSLSYEGGETRVAASFLSTAFFGISMYEASLRVLSLFFPYTADAHPRLRLRYFLAIGLGLAVPASFMFYFLLKFAAPEWPWPLESWVLQVGFWLAILFAISAVYDFLGPIWRGSASPEIISMERLIVRAYVWCLGLFCLALPIVFLGQRSWVSSRKVERILRHLLQPPWALLPCLAQPQ